MSFSFHQFPSVHDGFLPELFSPQPAAWKTGIVRCDSVTLKWKDAVPKKKNARGIFAKEDKMAEPAFNQVSAEVVLITKSPYLLVGCYFRHSYAEEMVGILTAACYSCHLETVTEDWLR